MAHQNSTAQSSSLVQIIEQSKSSNLLDVEFHNPPPKKRFTRFPLRTKVILTAIALSVIPTAIIGAVAYKVTENQIVRQINQRQLERTNHLAGMLQKYIASRANEAETLAASPIFTNPNLMNVATLNQKKAALDTFQEQTGFYDSIVYLDLQGNPLFQSKSERPLNRNYSDREYYHQAILNKHTSMNTVDISDITGEPRMEFAVPVLNSWTGEVIGVMRFRIPSEQIIPVFANYATKDEQWHLINTKGIFFASALENLYDQPSSDYFSQIPELQADKLTRTFLANNPLDPVQQQLVSYAPVRVGALNPQLNLGTALALDTNVALAPLNSLRWILLAGTVGTASLVGLLAAFLANRLIRPLLKLTSAVNQISQGKLDTRIKLDRQDELALLANQINDMAEQLDISLQRHRNIAKTSELIARMSQSQSIRELQLPFNAFLTEVRNFLKVDRVIFYQFDRQWQGTVIAESVAQGFDHTLGVKFNDNCFAREYLDKYQRGRIQAVANIYRANLSKCHLQQLEPYSVKASLVIPVIFEHKTNQESGKLIGLLIAHQCSGPRAWKPSYIKYLQQVAYQLATVLRGYVFYTEENFQKAGIQKDVAQVLSKMKNIADGDLTFDLAASSGDGGAIAQSFDKIISNMRETISQIKLPAKQLNDELVANQDNLSNLREQLRQQANQLVLIFSFIDRVANSAQEVSSQAKLASQTVNSVVSEVELEKANFNQAVAFMSRLENMLRNDTYKIKNLSNASQKMTRVIESITKINLRASLLTSKLSQRIPQAAKETTFGLREEIESIQQSIAATKKLETVIHDINREISQVILDYKANEQQWSQENYLKVDSISNLGQITLKVRSAQQYLSSLITVADKQFQNAQQITDLKDELNNTAQSLIVISDRAVDSLEQTAIDAKDLQNVANFFQLEPKSERNSSEN